MNTVSPTQWQEMRTRFLLRYPDFIDFSNPGVAFAKNELTHKRRILERFEERGLRITIAQLVAVGKGQEAVKALQRVNFGILIPAFQFWRIQFGETDQQACTVLHGLLETVAKPYAGPETLTPLLNATKNAGTKADWYVLDILWLFRPEDYFPVGISQMRKFARHLGVKLVGQQRLSTEHYPPMREFVLGFGPHMVDWKPKDPTDIQSVVWDLASFEPPGMNATLDNATAIVQEPPITERGSETDAVPKSRYTRDDALRDLFMPGAEVDKILAQLRRRKNIVLQGPPGVGKTFIAKRLAYLMMEERDVSRVKMVQFHQSYSYEDFIQGFRPCKDGSFRLHHGHFYEFCKRAEADEENAYFFIIDEINRGNLSKIFGELLMLLEADKRGPDFTVGLAYSSGDTGNPEEFSVPENLYVIGTMNTADKSLALVDFAMRRRFAFVPLRPQFGEAYQQWMTECDVPAAFLAALVNRINALNEEIVKDRQLGAGCCIGHSFFTPSREETRGDWSSWLDNVVRGEIEPLLNEYWPDDPGRAEQAARTLLGII